MVKIKLRRLGAKKKPTYELVVSDSRTARNGKIIVRVGSYNPMAETSNINVDREAVKYWISKGAQPTASVKLLLKKVDLV